METVFSSAARERKEQQLEGKNDYIHIIVVILVLLKILGILYLIFFLNNPSTENSDAQSEDKENDDKTDDEPNIKDVMKEAKAASGVLELRFIITVPFLFDIYVPRNKMILS